MPLQELKEKRQVEGIDGRPIESGDITDVAKAETMIQDHKEQLPMFVTKLGHYPVVSEIPWLQLHVVAVRFASTMVTFGSQYCMTHCQDAPVMVQEVPEEPLDPVYPQTDGIFEPQISPQQLFRGTIVMLHASSFFRTVKKGKLKEFEESLSDINEPIEAKDHKERPLEEVVLKQYHEFLRSFNTVLADCLPPDRRGIDHEVRLKEMESPT